MTFKRYEHEIPRPKQIRLFQAGEIFVRLSGLRLRDYSEDLLDYRNARLQLRVYLYSAKQ